MRPRRWLTFRFPLLSPGLNAILRWVPTTPHFWCNKLGEGSTSCREDSEKGEGIADFVWSVLAVDVQDLSHIVPHDDVYAVDDPNDWLVSDD
jgi:hypothetical protein